jgi:hypothetical protein
LQRGELQPVRRVNLRGRARLPLAREASSQNVSLYASIACTSFGNPKAVIGA